MAKVVGVGEEVGEGEGEGKEKDGERTFYEYFI